MKSEFEETLRALLDALDVVASTHEEVGDTVVRERMSEVVQDFFIEPRPGATWPETYGMRQPVGDALVAAALRRFVADASSTCARHPRCSAADRLAMFQSEDVESERGSFFDDYFGYQPPPDARRGDGGSQA